MRTVGIAARIGWGALLLIIPSKGLQLLGGHDTKPARRVLRVLGSRHLLQAAIEIDRGTRWHTIGRLADAAHCATALLFAWLAPGWRRAALTDAGVAGGFALLGLRDPSRAAVRAQ